MPSHQTRHVHGIHKDIRHARLEQKVFGVVHKPNISKTEPFVCDLPRYISSKNTATHIQAQLNDNVDRNLDMRCFFTGTQLTPFPLHKSNGWNHDSRIAPWLGTRDHLVPARRNTHQCPFDTSRYASNKVWCSNVVNTTLGLVPLPVRLKLRQWMQTDYWNRIQPSQDDGTNVRWLVIHYLDYFRIQGRYPWSRNKQGQWWYPEISQSFMAHMWHMEHEFLRLGEQDRNLWIQKFDWRF